MITELSNAALIAKWFNEKPIGYRFRVRDVPIDDIGASMGSLTGALSMWSDRGLIRRVAWVKSSNSKHVMLYEKVGDVRLHQRKKPVFAEPRHRRTRHKRKDPTGLPVMQLDNAFMSAPAPSLQPIPQTLSSERIAEVLSQRFKVKLSPKTTDSSPIWVRAMFGAMSRDQLLTRIAEMNGWLEEANKQNAALRRELDDLRRRVREVIES